VRTFLVLYLGEIHLLAEASNMSITKFTDLADKWVGDYGAASSPHACFWEKRPHILCVVPKSAHRSGVWAKGWRDR